MVWKFSFGCAVAATMLTAACSITIPADSVSTNVSSPAPISFNQPTPVVSSDGKVQITLPSDWSEASDLNDHAILQAAKALDEVYLIIVSYDKTDFSETGLEENVAIFLDELKQVTMNAEISEPTATKQINGNAAIQYKVNATFEGLNFTALSTLVETPMNYYQLYTWTLASQFADKQPEMQRIIQSFQEVSTTATTVPNRS